MSIAKPDISVVTSVYNGAQSLRESLDSVLSQQGVSLELIAVNDGSIDEAGEILEEYERRDRRVRVLHQANQGLTKALIRGCAEARGTYIVRHDAGDVSLPGRLAKQLACINQNPDAAFVSCGTRYVGPKGEFLYEINHDPTDATTRLLTLEMKEIRGPSSHPSTIFSRAKYEMAGGYRPAFYFAQDLDLWIRLAEHGRHIVMPEVLYQTSVTVGSISGSYRKEQIETARLILESARRRRDAKSDAAILEKAGNIKPLAKRSSNRLGRARALYFIGMCLRKQNHPGATNYFQEAFRAFPFHLKAASRLLAG